MNHERKRAHDESTATNFGLASRVIDDLLQKLRPSRADSPIDAEAGFELLIEQWSSSLHDGERELSWPYKARLRTRPHKVALHRFKKRLSSGKHNVWNLLEDASEEERPELVRFVNMLSTGEGRAKLITERGGGMDSANADEDVEEVDAPAEEQRTTIEAAAVEANAKPRWRPTLETGARIVLYGLQSKQYELKKGVVVGHHATDERYIVRLDDDDSLHLRARPRNVVRESKRCQNQFRQFDIYRSV